MEAPQVNVTFVDAQRLCASRGRRLCTTDEWRRACTGPSGRKWPYGDAAVSGRCRTAPAGDRNVGLSGGAAQCVTPEGVFDMVGNVAEWAAEGVVLGGSIATKNPTCATEAPGPADGASRRGKSARGPVGLRCCSDLR
jgi:formylglycine-generating enzyme required for sulfatase activity